MGHRLSKNKTTRYARNLGWAIALLVIRIAALAVSCSLYVDLPKTFNDVNHNILNEKLHQNRDLNGTALQLFTSCLTNRKQCTVVKGAKSKCRIIACGIPRSPTRGPLLLVMYINDLTLCSKFKIVVYGDDTNLSLSHTWIFTLQSMLNHELLKVVPFQNRPFHIRPITTDHSKQTTFITDLLITDPFITDRVHNRPRS